MPETVQHTEMPDRAPVDGQPSSEGSGAFAGLGLFSGLGAVAAKSCCFLPLVLTSTGLGGAWLSQELIAYQPYFLGVAWLSVVLAWGVAIRRRRVACAPGGSCETTATRWRGLALLVISTLIVALATVWEWIDPALAPSRCPGQDHNPCMLLLIHVRIRPNSAGHL
ncbi:MAG: hypothetical protein CMN55_03920 [Sneathiella sp.]|nr:hypothetical protein [Sneathiella sp.]|tara:strand:+ start:449 stop:946 length:498 start_codon:yes stop_codon:yes gene_type:complete